MDDIDFDIEDLNLDLDFDIDFDFDFDLGDLELDDFDLGTIGTSVEDAEEIKKQLSRYKMLDANEKEALVQKLDEIFKISSLLLDRSKEDFYIEAFEMMIKEDPYALTNNPYVSHLYQAVQKGKMSTFGFSQEQSDKVKDIAQINIPQEPVPDMSKFDTFISEGVEMDSATLEAFVDALKVIKNQESLLPESYCDYLFKLKLEDKLPIAKYESIFERAYEDKANHFLKKDGIDQKYVCHVSKEEPQTPDGYVAGRALDNVGIYFGKRWVGELSKAETYTIDVLYHECQHAKQYEHFGGDISGKEYTMLKEDLIRKVLGESYYDENYKLNHPEIDANVIALKEFKNFLRKLGYSMEEIEEMETCNSNGNVKNYKEEQRRLIATYSKDDNRRIRNSQETDVNDLFGEVLQKHPNYVKAFKVLQLEYNEDGTRKNRAELLKSYDNMLRAVMKDKNAPEKSSIRFMSTIMKSKHISEPSVLMDELEQLLDFEPVNNRMGEYLNDIIENGAFGLYMEGLENYGLKLNPNDSRQTQEDNFERLADMMFKFSKKHPDLDISKKMLGEPERSEKEGGAATSQDYLDDLDLLMMLYDDTTPQELQEGRTMIKSVKDMSKDFSIEELDELESLID